MTNQEDKPTMIDDVADLSRKGYPLDNDIIYKQIARRVEQRFHEATGRYPGEYVAEPRWYDKYVARIRRWFYCRRYLG